MRKLLALILMLATVHGASQVVAQEADNGTDPTKLRRMLWGSYEFMDVGQEISRRTAKLMFENPITDKTSLRVTVPVVGFNTPGPNAHAALGDIALRATHLLSVTRERGIVLQGEVFADSAARRELGNGTTVLKGTVIYAKFLEGGQIFAPAFSHAQSINGDNQMRETTADFYFVPRLKNPAWYMTIDPAVIQNWEEDRTYASIAVTTGRAVGQIAGGLAQVYLKPNVFIGGERPADWSIEAGFRVIGF